MDNSTVIIGHFNYCCCLITKFCHILCNPMDCAPSSSVHGVFQARILEWIAIFFSRDSQGDSLPLSYQGGPNTFNTPRPSGSDGKGSACNVGDLGLIPGLGRSPGEGNGYPPTQVFLPRALPRSQRDTTEQLTHCQWINQGDQQTAVSKLQGNSTPECMLFSSACGTSVFHRLHQKQASKF